MNKQQQQMYNELKLKNSNRLLNFNPNLKNVVMAQQQSQQSQQRGVIRQSANPAASVLNPTTSTTAQQLYKHHHQQHQQHQHHQHLLSQNQAGAGALNLNGIWYLDREDSDSTNHYLEAMGLPIIARQAADKLDLTVVIHQTPGDMLITRRTRIFTETKALKFGQDVVIKNNTIKLVGEPDHIKTVSQLPAFRAVLIDIRRIDRRGRMHVELQLNLPDKPPVITHRYFKKISDSSSLEDLNQFDLHAMEAQALEQTKRKR